MRDFTIWTRAATVAMAGIHHRLPVILNSEERDAWLYGSEDLSLGAGAALRCWPLRRFGLLDDGPELIEPVSSIANCRLIPCRLRSALKFCELGEPERPLIPR